ncbi:MAG: hypothetical protein U0234_29180 [Sandaracinus sp.]
MSRALLLVLASFLAIACLGQSSTALAQTITVHDLTVDGDPPPDEYRAMLDAAIARSVVPIRACYETSLRTHAGLRGDLPMRLWVSARQVIRVTLESHVGDTTLETCAHDRVHEFTLPPQAPEGGAAVHFVMTFTPGATTTAPPPPTTSIMTPVPPSSGTTTPTTTPAPTTPPAPPAVTVAVDRVRGALSQEALAYVYAHAGFEQCTTTQHGTVPVTVSVTAAGRARATAGRGTLRDAAYRRCIEQHVAAATHPTASASTRLRVTITRP